MSDKTKTKIIFDTDIGGDCDDAGALAMLHGLCDRGECELLAVTACYESPYVAGCIDSINRYYNRTVPIGMLYGGKNPSSKPDGNYTKQLCEQFGNGYPPESYKTVPDAVRLIRRLLSEAEDKSITLVGTGTMSTLAALIQSGADDISDLSGKQLVERKLLRTVIMGGRFKASWPMEIMVGGNPVKAEWNIKADIKGAQTMCDEWVGELVFSSYEIGLWCVTMKGFADNAPQDNPVRLAYELLPCARENGRESWDHTALLYAVRPDANYWNLHPYGKITVDDDGVTSWQRENGRHTYLLPNEDYETVRQIIDELVGNIK